MSIASIPNELIVKILSNLDTRDISVCRRVNRRWKQLINDCHLQSHAFFRNYCSFPSSSSPQKEVQSYNSSIRHWLTCFSEKGEALVKQLDTLLEHRRFHEILFFSIAGLLASTEFFNCENISALPHPHTVTNASFSPDGKHLVTTSEDNTVTIWGLVDGQWQEKAIITHTVREQPVRVRHAGFSPDGNHLVTAYEDDTVTIWGLVDGQWQEKKAIIKNSVLVKQVCFS